MIKVFIADDHAMMREGLKRIIASSNDMRVVGEAIDGSDVLTKIKNSDCDLVMLDMTMPGVSGLDLIKQVKKSRPSLPILILSMHNTGKIVASALRAGANGYLAKDSDPECLVDVIHKVASGGRHVDPAIAARIVFEGADGKQPHEYLSEREDQIFKMIVAGKTINQIAEELAINAKTVSTYKRRIKEKMKIDSTAELVRYAVAHHLTEQLPA